VSAVIIAVAVQRRKIIDHLLRAQADCPERALAPEALDSTFSGALRSLRSEGIVVATPSGQLYINRERLAAVSANRRIVGQLIFAIAVVALIVAALVALVHGA
jgi:hypothetical protein